MSQPFRLGAGGRIDRGKPIRFQFDGRTVDAFAGDTVASALLANGVHLVGRSFKYHRPRGILTAGSEEPNALFDVDRGNGRRDPNNRGTVVEAFDGLRVTSQNRWPSLAFDVGAVNDVVSPLLGAGFYYKTFMWPPRLWAKLYEPAIRRAAGLGVAPKQADPDRYVQRHAHADVLIVGAGPAGLAAALAASQDRTCRVVVCDEQAEPGGALLHDGTSMIEGTPAGIWLDETLSTLTQRPNVRLLRRTTAFGYYNHNHVCLAERLTDHLARPTPNLPRERMWQVRAARVILATGAHERPLVFPGNDRPGIMLAESVRTYLNRYAVAPGHRIVFATSGASAYTAAIDAKRAGLNVAIVDQRHETQCAADLALARSAGIECLTGHVVLSSLGRHRVAALVVAPRDRPTARRTLECDCVGLSGGWTPAVHLVSQSRGKLRYDDEMDMFVPGTSVQAETSVGAARGSFQLSACLAEGFAAGGGATPPAASPTLTGWTPARDLPQPVLPGKAFVDFQNDVTAKDLGGAVAEGFRSIEHVKRYTTLGMATDQGKTSNMNALGTIAGLLGTNVPGVGLTTFRPPYTPVTFGSIAGQSRGNLFDPIRTTPLHGWSADQGAVFEDVGQWKRAWYYPRGGEDLQAAVARECRAVRTAAGVFDASTLGKIEVTGPDAAEFLDRMYTNTISSLRVGRCRYGLMLKEDGYIMDDGVIARLGPGSFHVTTTTGGAARVLAHMEDYLQTEWPELKVYLTSITEQWAVIALQGPRARDSLAPLVAGTTIDAAAFPHMAIRECTVGGVAARLFRVSFTGELGFEINVPANDGQAVLQSVLASGARFGLTPYGTEAMHVLRAEKGYIIVSQETDGTVTPDDVGLAGLIGRNKRDFVGKRSLARPDLAAAGRKQLVGLLTTDPAESLEEGAQVVETPDGSRALGHVTSSYVSVAAGRSIALAVVANGRARLGTRLHVTTPRGFTPAEVTSPVFIDPEGKRLDA